MQANDAPSTQAGEAMHAPSNGVVATQAPGKTTSRRAVNGRQSAGSATRKSRKSSAAPPAAQTETPTTAPVAPSNCISPQVPPPGALEGLYRDFQREWERSRTLPQHPAYTPGFDLTALTLDALSNLDEVYNRELSWLDFNWRVLHEAIDPRTPLLERLKFIAITSSNLDEYFSKRVGGLKRQKAAGMANLTLDGWAPDVQLALIARAVSDMVAIESACLHEDILPQLAEHGIRLVNYVDLDAAERERLRDYFLREVYPILTPLAVDPGHPFPFISNLTLSLGVFLVDPNTGERQFARVKVPPSRPRWVQLSRQMHFLPLEQLIAAHLATLFRGMEVVAAFPFRVTRNADLARNEEEADDLLDMISEELRERRFAPVVRLEVAADAPPEALTLLQNQLHLENDDIYLIHGLLRRADLFALADINLPHLKYEPYTPSVPSRLAGISSRGRTSELFNAIRQGDLLVHHPYHSFQSTTQLFVEAAARDPQVLAIKQTIYRTSDNSSIIAALIDAASRGKQVAVLVEVKARFDEAKNVEWARKLEEAGCHVAYGLVGLKTHCKVSLAIRQEEDGLRAYYHIGTGNYNAKTSGTYTDLGLLSCNTEIAADLMDLFNALTGYSYQSEYRKLLVAPVNMRQRFLELIDGELQHALAGRGGRIVAKMNGLEDSTIVRKLYEASQAGVVIDLIVRGNCRLRPGLPGISENIRVISIIGRYLEHSRIFYFGNNGAPLYYIGSADWMRRNLSARVEAAVPIEDPRLQEYLWMILQSSLNDYRQAWEMLPDGRYRQRQPSVGSSALEAGGVHNYLMQHTRMTSTLVG